MAAPTPPQPPKPSTPGLVIEERQPLGSSRLWRLQQRYYEEVGQSAWGKGTVPWRVTTNPLMADRYAQVIAGWLRDWRASGQLDPREPVFVFEPGAGTGRLCFFLLRSLAEQLAVPAFAGLKVRYVLTDYSETNVCAWRDHPQLGALVQEGRLELAVHDATSHEPLLLFPSDQTLAQGSLRNPAVLIANYLFDSLPHELLAARDGELFEGLVTLRSERAEEENLDDAGLLGRVDPELDYRPAAADLYGDASLRARLAEYARLFDDGPFLFPRGSLACLETFGALAPKKLLVLVADKGEHQLDALRGLPTLRFAKHGSVSFMVNFHLLGALVESSGGRWLQSPTAGAALNVCAYVTGSPSLGLAETELSYHHSVGRFGPLEAHRLADGLAAAGDALTVGPWLAHLRVSQWDPDVVLRFADFLRARVGQLAEADREVLAAELQVVGNNDFFVAGGPDLPFVLGTLYQRLGRVPDAARWYARSLQHHGESFASLFNLALCLADLGDAANAVVALEQAVKLDPEHERARTLLAELSAARGG